MRAILLPLARLADAYPQAAKTVIALAIMALGLAFIPPLIHGYGLPGLVGLLALLFVIGFWLERRSKVY